MEATNTDPSIEQFERFSDAIKPIINSSPDSWTISDLAKKLGSITTRGITQINFRSALYRNIRLYGNSLPKNEQDAFFDRYDHALAIDHREAQESAVDPKTSLDRESSFIPKAIEEIQMDPEQTIMFVDLDNFGMVNKKFGGDVGDQMLKTFADNARKYFGNLGLICRWGGEEFVFLFKSSEIGDLNTSSEKNPFASAMENLQNDYNSDAIKLLQSKGLSGEYGITLTAGIRTAKFNTALEIEPQLRSAIKDADSAMRAAKISGKDRVLEWAEQTQANLDKLNSN